MIQRKRTTKTANALADRFLLLKLLLLLMLGETERIPMEFKKLIYAFLYGYKST